MSHYICVFNRLNLYTFTNSSAVSELIDVELSMSLVVIFIVRYIVRFIVRSIELMLDVFIFR